MTMNNQPSVCAGFTPESKSFPANIGKYAVWMPILFLLLTLLRNPTLYYMPGKAYNIDFFTMGGLALAAFAFLFFDFRRLAGTLIGMEKIPLAALFVFFGIAAGHFLMNSRLSIQHFGASLVWIAVPLLVCAYYDSFLKLLPAYFSFLCLFNLFYSFIEVLMNHQFIFGISGNINWNVSLIVMTTPFLFCIFCGTGCGTAGNSRKSFLSLREELCWPSLLYCMWFLIQGPDSWHCRLFCWFSDG